MGAIVDTLRIDQAGLAVLTARYPTCVLESETDSFGVEQYRLTIPDESEESYYNFLIDKVIAMCSANFQEKFSRDPEFRDRIKARAHTNIAHMKSRQSF